MADPKNQIPESRVNADRDSVSSPSALDSTYTNIPDSRVGPTSETYENPNDDLVVKEAIERIHNEYKKEIVRIATSKEETTNKKQLRNSPAELKQRIFNTVANIEIEYFKKNNPDKYHLYKNQIKIGPPVDDGLENITPTEPASNLKGDKSPDSISTPGNIKGQERITQIQEETPFFDESVYKPENTKIFDSAYKDPEIDYVFEQIDKRADAIHDNAKSEYQKYLKDVRQKNKELLQYKGKPLKQKARIAFKKGEVRKERIIPEKFEELYDTDVVLYRLRMKAYEELKTLNPQKAKAYKNELLGIDSQTDVSQVINPFNPSTGNMPFVDDMSEKDLGKLKKLYGRKYAEDQGKEIYQDAARRTIFFKDPNDVNNIYDLEFIRKYAGDPSKAPVAGSSRFLGVVPGGYQIEKPKGKTLEQLTLENNGKPIELSKEQAQKIIDLIDEFQKTTGQVQGYEIRLDEKGEPHLEIQGFRPRNKYSLSPRQNLIQTRKWLKDTYGKDWKGKVKLPTRTRVFRNDAAEIADAEEKQKKFKAAVDADLKFQRRRIIFQDRTKITGFKLGTYHVRSFDSPGGIFGKYSTIHQTTGRLATKARILLRDGKRAVQSAIVKGSQSAGAAIGSAIIPIPGVGTAIGSWIGKKIGGILADPIGFVKRVIKRIIKAILGLMINLAIAFAVLLVLTIFIVFIINSGAYLVPPGQIEPPSDGESDYIRVQKVADPSGRLPNASQEVAYTVTITALATSLANITVTDTCSVSSDRPVDPPCPQIENIRAGGSSFDSLQAAVDNLTISPSASYVITYTRNYIFGGNRRYEDSRVVDSFTVEATVAGGPDSASGFASICFGECPANCPSIWPVSASPNTLYITQGAYCPRYSHGSYGGLEAIDIGGTGYNTPILASHDGTVTASRFDECYGQYIDIETFCENKRVYTRYAHLSVRSVSAGAIVLMGQEIGISGNSTGSRNCTTGPHLHYDFRCNNIGTFCGAPNDSYRNNPPFMARDYIPQDVPRLCCTVSGCGVRLP